MHFIIKQLELALLLFFSSSSHLVVSSTNSLGDSMRSGGNSLILKSCQLLAEILPTSFWSHYGSETALELFAKAELMQADLKMVSFSGIWLLALRKTWKIQKLQVLWQLSSGGTALLGNSPWRWKQWRDWKQWNCDEVKCSFRYNNKFVFISNSSNFPNTKFQKM